MDVVPSFEYSDLEQENMCLLIRAEDPVLGLSSDSSGAFEDTLCVLEPSSEMSIDLNHLKVDFNVGDIPVIFEEVASNPKKDQEGTGVQCPTCFKMLSNGSTLKKHIRVHTNERPHQCTKCAYSATQRQNLTRHLLTVHCGGSPMRFVCKIVGCSFKTNRADKMKDHMRRKHAN